MRKFSVRKRKRFVKRFTKRFTGKATRVLTMKKRRRKGLPKTRVTTLGRYVDPIAQARLNPRRAKIQLSQRYTCVDTVPQSAGVGVISSMFFCNNNISPAAFVSPGDNIDGLSTLMKVQSAANPPRGVNQKLFDLFIYGMVMASAIRVRVERTNGPSNLTDGEFYVALTPLSHPDAVQVVGGVAGTHLVYGTNVFTGSTPQQQWDSVIDMPGTRYGRIGNWNGGLSQKVILRMKHNQAYFNPEPSWVAASGSSLWCSRTSPLVFGGTNFWNWYALTFYSPQGIASAAAIPINIMVDQRWYVRAWDPVAPAILT